MLEKIIKNRNLFLYIKWKYFFIWTKLDYLFIGKKLLSYTSRRSKKPIGMLFIRFQGATFLIYPNFIFFKKSIYSILKHFSKNWNFFNIFFCTLCTNVRTPQKCKRIFIRIEFKNLKFKDSIAKSEFLKIRFAKTKTNEIKQVRCT